MAKFDDGTFHKIEMTILRAALIVILVLTLIRLILPEIAAVKNQLLPDASEQHSSHPLAK